MKCRLHIRRPVTNDRSMTHQQIEENYNILQYIIGTFFFFWKWSQLWLKWQTFAILCDNNTITKYVKIVLKKKMRLVQYSLIPIFQCAKYCWDYHVGHQQPRVQLELLPKLLSVKLNDVFHCKHFIYCSFFLQVSKWIKWIHLTKVVITKCFQQNKREETT